MVTVSDLLKTKGTDIHRISPTTTIQAALYIMAQKDIGAVPVVDEQEKLVGIFSERDFARLLAKEGCFPLDTPIQDIMTKKVFTVTSSTSMEDCMQLMTDKHIRHLPVVVDDRLAGMISIGDVVKTVISSQKDFIAQLEGYISGRW